MVCGCAVPGAAVGIAWALAVVGGVDTCRLEVALMTLEGGAAFFPFRRGRDSVMRGTLSVLVVPSEFVGLEGRTMASSIIRPSYSRRSMSAYAASRPIFFG